MSSAEQGLPFSFLVSFAKRSFTVNEQIKLIHDFLGVSRLGGYYR